MGGMEHDSMPRGERAEKPWMRNERWSSGVIRDQSAENLVAIWIFTLAWNIVTALALIPRAKEAIHGHDRWWLLALVFPAVGLGLVIWASCRMRRVRKFGASVFHLRTLPATPGGELAGTIHVARKFQAKSGVQLQLVCIYRFVSGFGRSARVTDRVIWHETQMLDPVALRDVEGDEEDGAEIPVLFQLPPDAKPSSDLPMGDGFRWRLEARCKTGGVGYYSRFEVPVFVVAPSKSVAARGRDLVNSRRSAEASDPRRNLSERGILCERFASGRLRIVFGSARNRSSVVFTTIIGLALSAMAIGLANWSGSGRHRIIKISLASIFLFAGGIFCFKAIFNWLVTDEIIVRYGSLTVEREAPLFRHQRTFKLGEVSDVFPKIEGNSWSDSDSGSVNKKRFHRLMLKTRDGDLICLASDINQKEYAAWLADEIKEAFGVGTGK
jgi:hypothetical protein